MFSAAEHGPGPRHRPPTASLLLPKRFSKPSIIYYFPCPSDYHICWTGSQHKVMPDTCSMAVSDCTGLGRWPPFTMELHLTVASKYIWQPHYVSGLTSLAGCPNISNVSLAFESHILAPSSLSVDEAFIPYYDVWRMPTHGSAWHHKMHERSCITPVSYCPSPTPGWGWRRQRKPVLWSCQEPSIID